MVKKSIPASQPTVPQRVPLDQSAPNIYRVASWMLDEVCKLETFLEAINRAAKDRATSATSTLMHIEKLSHMATCLAGEWSNDRDIQIAACMLASDDPEIRAEARS